jgi:hypothetical protein
MDFQHFLNSPNDRPLKIVIPWFLIMASLLGLDIWMIVSGMAH